MNAQHAPVLDLALALLRAPERLAALRLGPLPDDLRPLLRILAGDVSTLTAAAAETGQERDVLREAAVLFAQQVLLAEDSDSYRVLGVNPDATDTRLREHHRLLLRWLHPDRNSDDWESVLVYRVNRAWQELRRPERRNHFDRMRNDMATRTAEQRTMPSAHVRTEPCVPMPSSRTLSSRTLRRLPTLVLGGTAFAAFAVLGLLYLLRLASPSESILQTSSPLATDEPTLASSRPVPVGTLEPTAEFDAPVDPIAVDDPATVAEVAQTTSVDPAPTFHTAPDSGAVVTPAATQSRVDDVVHAERTTTTATRPNLPATRQAAPPPRIAAIAPEMSVPAPVPMASMSIDVVSDLPPDAPTIQTPSSPARVIDEQRVHSLVRRFSEVYADGDLERLAAMLSRDGATGSTRSAILREYGRLFRATDRRHIRIDGINWIEEAESAVIIASFDASVVRRGRGEVRQFNGDIRFDLRVEEGDLRIHRLSHDSHGS